MCAFPFIFENPVIKMTLFMVSGMSRKHLVYKQIKKKSFNKKKYIKIYLCRLNLILLVRRE